MLNLAARLEHTILSPTATIEEINRACQEVEQFSFAGLCINSCYVSLAAHFLFGKGFKVISTCSFPLGSTTTQVKVFEAQKAVESRANELDMVMNLPAAKNGNWDAVAADIKAVVEASGVPVKVIIETNLLTEQEIEKACQAVLLAGAYCVKTCTGSFGGVQIKDVRLIRNVVGEKVKIKASGGIKTKEQVEELLRAGADIIGTSSAVAICR